MRGRLEAAEKATGPTAATVEGASAEVSAAVMKKIGRVFLPACKVGGGGGVRVGCGL